MDRGPVSEKAAVQAASAPRARWVAWLGPGIVYGLSVLGTGDIVSNSAAGASYGYHLLWALAMALIFRYVWVNASAKYVLVTGESLLNGYRRAGRWIPWVVMLAYFPIRHLTNEYLILMMGSSAHLLLPLPSRWSAVIWACTFTLLGFALTFWGGYPAIERFCKLLVGVMGLSLLVGALLSGPDPAAVVSGALIPHLPQAKGLYSSLLIVMALIGTEAGSTANLIYAYFIREKGWRGISYLSRQRMDLALGVVALFLMGGLLQVAAAATVHPLGLQVEDPEDLARIFSETQGTIGLIVFSLGLWGAAFSSFIGFNLGQALVFTDICRNVVPGLKDAPITREADYHVRRDPVYRFMIAFWSFSPLYIVFTEVHAVWIVLMSNALQVLIIPVLAYSLLRITNDRNLMGRHRNGWLTNLVLTALVGIALYFTYRNAGELWRNLGQLR